MKHKIVFKIIPDTKSSSTKNFMIISANIFTDHPLQTASSSVTSLSFLKNARNTLQSMCKMFKSFLTLSNTLTGDHLLCSHHKKDHTSDETLNNLSFMSLRGILSILKKTPKLDHKIFAQTTSQDIPIKYIYLIECCALIFLVTHVNHLSGRHK